MSAACPSGQGADAGATAFGLCLEAARTLDPTRPDPTRPAEGEGLFEQFDSLSSYSPFPKRSLPSAYTHAPTTLRQVWQTLLSGLHAISENDYRRPWPYPRRDRLAALIAEHDEDLCLKAAVETKSIVQSQDRAPNITSLFEKKLRDLAEIRATVRGSLAAGGEG